MGLKDIVLANDDIILNYCYGALFSNEGWKPHIAKSSDQVIPKIEAFSPSVVILDCMLPPIRLRRVLDMMSERDYQIPVLVMSALGNCRQVYDEMEGHQYKGKIEVVDNIEGIESVYSRIVRLTKAGHNV